MRVSDWSSDVCSTDLLVGQLAIERRQPGGVKLRDRPPQAFRCGAGGFRGSFAPHQCQRPVEMGEPMVDADDSRPGWSRPDTQSVANGKRVSDRVAIGGRPPIQPKHLTTPPTDI